MRGQAKDDPHQRTKHCRNVNQVVAHLQSKRTTTAIAQQIAHQRAQRGIDPRKGDANNHQADDKQPQPGGLRQSDITQRGKGAAQQQDHASAQPVR